MEVDVTDNSRKRKNGTECGYDVTGVDITPEYIEYATKQAQTECQFYLLGYSECELSQ